MSTGPTKTTGGIRVLGGAAAPDIGKYIVFVADGSTITEPIERDEAMAFAKLLFEERGPLSPKVYIAQILAFVSDGNESS